MAFRKPDLKVYTNLDRAIDQTIHRHLMNPSPPPQIYDAVMRAVRKEPQRRLDVSTSVICGGGLAAAVVLIVFAIAITVNHGTRAGIPGPVFQCLTWIHTTGLSIWINESESFLGYPTILFLHTLGLAALVGFSVSTDVRLLGIAPRIPIPSLSRLFPFMWFGLWVNVISGTLLFIADPIRKAMNPLFEIKLALVALGLVVMVLIQRQLYRIEKDSDAERRTRASSRFLAIASLAIWAAAITAGRLLAYLKGF